MGIWLRKTVLSVFILGISVGGCTLKGGDSTDPKDRLTAYISKSFAINSVEDRRTLESYLTGDAKFRLQAWSDEQFSKAFIESKRQFIKLGIKEVKQVSENEMGLTYELTTIDEGRGHNAKVINKKLCTMVREDGVWFIRDVMNIKELVEYKNEMALP